MFGPGARAELEYREVPPVAPLTPFVRRYWVLRGVAPVGHLRRILPDGCADVLFEVVDGGAPRGRWIGIMTRPFEARLEGPVDLFGVRFEPGGLHALAGLPLHPFTDGEVPVDAADPLGLGMLGEAVAAAPSFAHTPRARRRDRRGRALRNQAHFIREFRAFAGETPGAWGSPRAVSEIFKPGLGRDGIVGASTS